MANYSDLRKLARVQLPNGAKPYALIDKDLRLIIATDFNELSGVYHEGDHVFYQDDLYRFKTDHSAGAWNSAQVDQVTIDGEIKRLEGLITPFFSTTASYTAGDHVIYQGKFYRFSKDKGAGAWDSSKVAEVTIDSEIKRIESIIADGIHYIGKTTTPLYDGSSETEIEIVGKEEPVDAKQGDMVILKLFDKTGDPGIATEYSEHTGYNNHTYIKHLENGSYKYYITIEDISANINTSFKNIEDKLDKVKSEPEFLFDGDFWNLLGPVADGLGELAFKDAASGEYDKTSKAEVVIYTYDIATSKLVTKKLYAVSATDAVVSKVIAKNNGSPTGDTTLTVGNAKLKNDGSEVLVKGIKSGSTTVFNTDAINNAVASGTTVFNTDAVKNVHASGTTVFNTEGYVAQVGSDTAGWEDCLIFAIGATNTFTIEAEPAATASFVIATTPAGTGTFELATGAYYTVEPASYTIDITSATAASRLTEQVTYATGGVASDGLGSPVAIDVDQGTEIATATLEYATTTITVR